VLQLEESVNLGVRIVSVVYEKSPSVAAEGFRVDRRSELTNLIHNDLMAV